MPCPLGQIHHAPRKGEPHAERREFAQKLKIQPLLLVHIEPVVRVGDEVHDLEIERGRSQSLE